MRVYMKRNKNIILQIFSFVILATVGILVFLPANDAQAYEVGCYVTSQGAVTASTCPEKDSDGNNIDPSKCYFAPGSSQGIGSYELKNCDGSSISTSGGGTGSNSYCDQNPSDCAPINPGGSINYSDGNDGKQCGKGDHTVTLSIDIGCRGDSFPGTGQVNPIVDMMFAFFRFLSAGAGIVIIGSIVVAGIQYTTSRGNPQATEASIKRVTSSVIALLLYLFIFAIANYLIPGGMLI